jgi:isopentenyl phosphate kinase
MEAIFLHGGGFFSHVKAKPVNLCRRSSTRGSLHKSI